VISEDMDVNIATDNKMSAKTVEMRKRLEALGYWFQPSFEKCVEIVRRNMARQGDFMSFDEVACRICEGGLVESKVNGLIE